MRRSFYTKNQLNRGSRREVIRDILFWFILKCTTLEETSITDGSMDSINFISYQSRRVTSILKRIPNFGLGYACQLDGIDCVVLN